MAVAVVRPFHGPLYEKLSKTLFITAEFRLDIQVLIKVLGTPEQDF
jgi:hypothetical protein